MEEEKKTFAKEQKYAAHFDINGFNDAYRRFRNAETEEEATNAYKLARGIIMDVDEDRLSLKQFKIYTEMTDTLDAMHKTLSNQPKGKCRRLNCTRYAEVDTGKLVEALDNVLLAYAEMVASNAAGLISGDYLSVIGELDEAREMLMTGVDTVKEFIKNNKLYVRRD